MLWNILFFTYPAHYCPEYFAEINYINWCNGSIYVLISYNQLLATAFFAQEEKKSPHLIIILERNKAKITLTI